MANNEIEIQHSNNEHGLLNQRMHNLLVTSGGCTAGL